MSLTIGALAMTLWIGAGSAGYAQDQQNNQPNTPAASNGAAAPEQKNGGMNGTGMGRRSSGRDRMQNNMPASDMSSMDMVRMDRIRWSGRYWLTPLEHKRLRAMGLGDNEVFALANASRESGLDPDEIAQMVLRGRSFFQISEQLGIPYDSLMHRRPEWQTAEWEQGVREGWFSYAQGGGMSAMPSDRRPNR